MKKMTLKENEVREFLISKGEIGKFDEIHSMVFIETMPDICVVKIWRNTQSDFRQLEIFFVWKDNAGKWNSRQVELTIGACPRR